MRNFARRVVAPILSVAALLFFTALTGCGKGESGSADRTKGSRDAQASIARRQQPLLANAERMRARAKAALGAGATDAQVESELDANPAKYPGWKELKASLAQAGKDMDAAQAEARATIRKRILKEAAEKKAARKTK